jgi:hypothetical protein
MPPFFRDELPDLPDVVGLAPPFAHATWKRLAESQLGVGAVDPDGHDIGVAPAVRKVLGVPIGSWVPVDGKKHTIIGEVDRYQFYNPITSGDEADFNIMIAPDPAFMFLLDDVVQSMTPKQREELHLRTRGPSGFCVECEITPDEAYYSNPWFPTKGQKSPLIGQKLGLYGPWVGDAGHGGRPEIHPCEVIWWKKTTFSVFPPGRSTVWRVLLLQDDSNRFDRAGDFGPGVKRPWSASPRRVKVVMALAVPKGRSTRFEIDIARGRNEREFPNELRNIEKSLPDNTKVTISKDGMSRHGRVKARLNPSFGKDPINESFRLFLHLELEVGQGDRGQEGFAEVVVKTPQPLLPLVSLSSLPRRMVMDTPVRPTSEHEAEEPATPR